MRRCALMIAGTACALILLLTLLSVRGSATWISSNQNYMLSIAVGEIWFDWDYDSNRPQAPMATGWSFRWHSSYGFKWWPSGELRRVSGFFTIPLWVVLGVSGLATAWLYRRIHPATKPGCCRKCGYSLIGLTEPRCPECGTPFQRG